MRGWVGGWVSGARLCFPVRVSSLLRAPPEEEEEEAPDTPPDLKLLRRELKGFHRAQHVLDANGFKRLGELEFDVAEREKKFQKTGR